jgi:hypothetical protein
LSIEDSTLYTLERKVLSSIERNKHNLTKIFDDNYNNIVKYFGIDTFRNISNKKAYDKFTIDDNVKDYINRVTAFKVTKITDNSKNAIRKIIINGISNNDNIGDIAKKIKKVYEIWTDSRARTIARTEVASISNYAMWQGAIQAEAEKKKWIFNDDIKVRLSHRAMGKHKDIGINELFQVGNSKMLYPGDFQGEAKEVINCRCYLEFK